MSDKREKTCLSNSSQIAQGEGGTKGRENGQSENLLQNKENPGNEKTGKLEGGNRCFRNEMGRNMYA